MIEVFEDYSPRIADDAWVHSTAAVMGDVTLGAAVSVWPSAVLRGDVNAIVVGARSNVQDGAVVHVAHEGPYQHGYPALIGEEVTVGHRAVVHACTIGNRVLVGMGAIILDGAWVDDEVIIGANTLVPPGKRLEAGFLYLGSPARPVRPLTATEREQLPYSAQHYVKLMQRHRDGSERLSK
ncbi:MAG: gamma carbonic anhydrase family protein [Spiribacter sp.]|nr:gamma carbonic anhydrase family protein [Spiribacter sp.]MDR9488800.1 gamma carbonic anhydrase family protein [Spiribacter sp.]